MSDAAEMVSTCYRRQHPEEFGGHAVPEESLPAYLTYGRDFLPPTPHFPEEPMGDPDAEMV